MIEFEPLEIGSSTFRKHWVVVYKEIEQVKEAFEYMHGARHFGKIVVQLN
jgi:hypothetical protein